MMKYKPSMFNHIVRDGLSIILYNSFGGTKSLIRVPEEKADKVVTWLNCNGCSETTDEDFNRLVEAGYLVPDYSDEKNIRKLKYMSFISENRLNLIVHTTKACNFRCSYCYMDFQPVSMRPDIQQGIVNYIRSSIQRYRSVRISWFGGEPTLAMEVIENISYPVMDICYAQKKPYSAIITTNGYNLTPENINRLISCHINHIAVTIDGNRSLHDRQRMLVNGSPTFDRIIENLMYIRDYVKSRTLTVSIRTNIMKEHIRLLNEYYDFFNKVFGEDHRFSLFIRPVADYGGERVKALTDSFIHDMHPVYDYLSLIQKNIKFFPNFIDLEIGGYTCTARQMYKYTVGCDGSISKCDESLDHSIGHLYPDGCMDLDENEHAKWIFNTPRKRCEDCFFSGSCFMELCPKARIYSNYTQCPVNFLEIDSLILLAANTYNIKVL